jgi:chromosome segregation protein
MLKALELSGFKSFADKTRFEFPAGITVVVGPNGSGKSNIVDGIKWVLGEQSAKSLRGKDMSDVIFKGSGGANGRRPANAATATIVLDNSDKRFAYDAEEVLVTRRVYRSGESEYLINGETSRLKDIRELFRGTGVGTDAYSLIEQGKVERMLSTNAKDRRAIFEEAAGISRFKAKKKDAERRLARVDGNLIRLADIVEEVGSRYRSVKAQASKAVRYKEYSDRLQSLRTYVGTKDWRDFTEKLSKIQTELQEHTDAASATTKEIEQFESQTKTVETELEQASSKWQETQNRSATLRESIARSESTLQLNQARLKDIRQRENQVGEQLKLATKRASEAEARIAAAEKDAEDSELNFREASDRMKQLESEFQQVESAIQEKSALAETKRNEHQNLMSLVSQLGRSVSAADSQLQNLVDGKTRLSQTVDELNALREQNQSVIDRANAEIKQLEQEADSKDSDLAKSRQQLETTKSELDGRRQRLTDLTSQHSGLTQRAQVIEELEKSLEGINAGAKELLKHAGDPTGPMSEIIGLVADLVSVNVQHAALVDVALGDIAQFVIVSGEKLISQIAAGQIKLGGRVGLIQLDTPPTLGADPEVSLNGVNGVIGRADRLVQVKPQYVDFIRKLLGGTWLVKTLGDALHLRETHDAADRVRFITLDGEILEADGAVVVGPKSVTSGLVSRRSELRALKREIQRLDEETQLCRTQVDELTKDLAESEQQVESQLNENSELAAKLSAQQRESKAAAKQLQTTHRQLETANQELNGVVTKLTDTENQLATDRQQLTLKEAAIATIMALVGDSETSVNSLRKQRTDTEKSTTAAKVKLAKAEQVLEGVQSRVAQFREEAAEQKAALEQVKSQSSSDSEAEKVAAKEIETATSQLQELREEFETIDEVLQKADLQRTELDAQRRKVATELRGKQDQMRLSQDKVHQAKSRIEQLTLQRQQLAERMQDDYGIDIADENADVESKLTEEEIAQRDQVDAEISDLRKKLSSIGSVNLDALQELEDLESRYLDMDSQYQDLVQAKETLQKIIARIDTDSRKLFVETLEIIRVNFQKLFRQTFGGGKADIILEPDVDPLEAGVDIIATPPGKPEFNNSLLSGGEKALTAVSLLMAIFQFRPSPFCVLDEVDAPFDEANIGRFVDVLKSFLGWTKFVIVTHSKKTMTAATTLYGITMQESGVSKRVSVRFEDVSEDGHISDEAIQRDGAA